MNCQRVEEKLSEYSAGELRAEEHQQVRLHLQECAACEDLRIKLEKTWDLLGAWDGLEPGPTFQAQVWEKVRTSPRPGFAWAWLTRWAMLAASLLVVAGVWTASRPGPAAETVLPVPVAVVAPDYEAMEFDPLVEEAEATPVLEIGQLSDSWLDGAHTVLEKEL